LEKTKLRLIYRWQPIKSRSQGRTATWWHDLFLRFKNKNENWLIDGRSAIFKFVQMNCEHVGRPIISCCLQSQPNVSLGLTAPDIRWILAVSGRTDEERAAWVITSQQEHQHLFQDIHFTAFKWTVLQVWKNRYLVYRWTSRYESLTFRLIWIRLRRIALACWMSVWLTRSPLRPAELWSAGGDFEQHSLRAWRARLPLVAHARWCDMKATQTGVYSRLLNETQSFSWFFSRQIPQRTARQYHRLKPSYDGCKPKAARGSRSEAIGDQFIESPDFMTDWWWNLHGCSKPRCTWQMFEMILPLNLKISYRLFNDFKAISPFSVISQKAQYNPSISHGSNSLANNFLLDLHQEP
jgi:hypothetical protein